MTGSGDTEPQTVPDGCADGVWCVVKKGNMLHKYSQYHLQYRSHQNTLIAVVTNDIGEGICNSQKSVWCLSEEWPQAKQWVSPL